MIRYYHGGTVKYIREGALIKFACAGALKTIIMQSILHGEGLRPPVESPTIHNTSNIQLCLGMHHVLYIGYIQHNQ